MLKQIDLQTVFHDHTWLVVCVLTAVAAFFVHSFLAVLARRLQKRFANTPSLWDETIIAAIYRPLATLIWVLATSIVMEVVSREHLLSLHAQMPVLRQFAILVIIAWFLLRLVRIFEVNLLKSSHKQHKKIDKTMVHAVSQLMTAVIVIVTTIVGMQLFKLPITGILTFGGIGGAGVAFAAKDILGNFFGGLMIYMDRPFKVGDWIRSPDKNIEGTVEYVGWRTTRVRTFDKRPLYIPNGVFTTVSIENPSRMLNRRIKVFIGLRYEDADKLNAVLEDIRSMLKQHPDIDTTQTLMVNFTDFASSALEFMIYTFTKTTVWTEYQAVREKVLLQVLEIITQHGAECAYHTQTLHLKETVTD